MVPLVIVVGILGLLVVSILGLLAWAFWAGMREAGELESFATYIPEGPADEALMLAQYQAKMKVDADLQRARWAGLRRGMEG